MSPRAAVELLGKFAERAASMASISVSKLLALAAARWSSMPEIEEAVHGALSDAVRDLPEKPNSPKR